MSLQHTLRDDIVTITFDRPASANAMTFAMYDLLAEACDYADATPGVRVVVLRGAGGAAFVSGTDIAELERHVAEHGGASYERTVEEAIARVEAVKVPVVAAVEGVAVGAGLVLAAVADLCVCSESSRFGAPIARTVGNCLSIKNCARLIRHVGERHVKELLYTADLIDATEAQRIGFVNRIFATGDFDTKLTALVKRLASNAPLSLAASKEAYRRLAAFSMPDDGDIIDACYGSSDFREGARAFQEKRKAVWSGS